MQNDRPIHLIQFTTANGWEALPARVISESTVTLTVNGEVWISFMCTPADLEALAVGFLYNEGIIHSMAEVEAVSACENVCNVDVWLNHRVKKPAQWRRTSGCTGGVTSDQAKTEATIPFVQPEFDPDSVLNAMNQLLEVQELYREARGVHCSAMSDGQQIVYRAEDIGRHNTLDKLSGLMLMQPKALERRIIVTTGRISSEMLQKSARLGAQVVISRTSPTAMSVEMADEIGITLIGYARRNQFLVYAHPERLMKRLELSKAIPVVQLA
jgi:FdhD protein